jgi:SOS-response transcriptional repressor LexA
VSWATHHISALIAGQTVQFRPRGNSMVGRVESGQLVTVEPLGSRAPQKGEIVLCKVQGAQYLHLVKSVQGDRYLIGNNRGGTNGWTSRAQIFGRCIRVEA